MCLETRGNLEGQRRIAGLCPISRSLAQGQNDKCYGSMRTKAKARKNAKDAKEVPQRMRREAIEADFAEANGHAVRGW